MEIKFDLIDKEVGEAVVTGNSTHGVWIHRSMTIRYVVTVNDVELSLTYSNGEYKYNDYNCHNNIFTISDYNTDDFLYKLQEMSEDDVFSSDNENSNELIELMRDRGLDLNNFELVELRTQLLDNIPKFCDYSDDDENTFVIKKIEKLKNTLKVTFSHDIVEYIDAKSKDDFFNKVKELSYSDEFSENYNFFRYMFNSRDNEEIVNKFFKDEWELGIE